MHTVLYISLQFLLTIDEDDEIAYSAPHKIVLLTNKMEDPDWGIYYHHFY